MLSNLEDRAVTLLSSGLPAGKVAEALGVTPARISQLMDDPEFKAKLTENKFKTLTRHNEADAKLDELEQKVLSRIDETLDMVMRPMELTKIFQVINAAKRRGTSLLGEIPDQGTVVNLSMPTKVINNFVTNINNQVIKAGGEDLITMQPSRLKELLNESLISQETGGNLPIIPQATQTSGTS